MENDRRDHGYAWVILMFSISCNTLFAAVCLCPPLFLTNLTEAFGLSTYEAGWIISMNSFLLSISTVPVGILVEKIGCKATGFAGALLGSIALVCSSQIYNLTLFIISFSVLSGIFVSLTRLPPVVIIQTYFNKKRPFASGFSLTGYSIGVFGCLPFIAFLIEYFGWRGAMMLVGGMCLNMCFIMLTFSPIKQPGKAPPKSTMDTTNNCKKSLTDCSLLKDVNFLMVAVSFTLFQFGADLMFKVSTPRAELDLNVDKLTASSIISVMSITGFISRFISSIIANLPFVSTLAMYAFSILVGGAVIVVSSFMHSLKFMLVAAGVYGVTFSMTTTVQTTVLVDLLGVDKISRSQGLVSAMPGVVYLITIPFAGWTYDTFQSFSIAYFTGGIVQCIGGVIAVILFCKTAQKKRMPSSGQDTNYVIQEKLHIKSLENVKWTPVLLGSIQSLSSLS